jgi:HSP20 family protein
MAVTLSKMQKYMSKNVSAGWQGESAVSQHGTFALTGPPNDFLGHIFLMVGMVLANILVTKLFKEREMRTLTLYRPNAIQHALSDFDRCLETFFGDFPLAPATKTSNRLPAVDIRETEKAYALEMELPGYDEKNIEIHVDGSTLSIASKQEKVVPPTESASPAESVPFIGPREEKAKEEAPSVESAPPKESWILKERHISTFCRSFKLPENANPEEISAEFKNGVLSLEIQKRAEAQKRTIQIRTN